MIIKNNVDTPQISVEFKYVPIIPWIIMFAKKNNIVLSWLIRINDINIVADSPDAKRIPQRCHICSLKNTGILYAPNVKKTYKINSIVNSDKYFVSSI
jgi:hypothetical protein